MAFAACHACLCCCCLTGFLIRTTVAFLVLFSATVLLFYAAANPHKMNVSISEASLTQFDFNEVNRTILHDLRFHMSIRNPNRIVGFFYDDFSMIASRRGNYINGDWMRFYQGPKNTTVFKFDLVGDQEVYLEEGSEEAETFKAGFEAEKRARVFDIDVEVELMVRARVGRVRIGIFQPKIRCVLKVPLVSAERRKSGETGFGVTECDVVFQVRSLIEPLD